jgi:hypothetical protein
MSPDYNRAVPTIDLPDDELAAVAAAIRRLVEGDRYPHAPRLDPLRGALARLEAAASEQKSPAERLLPPSRPKAPPAAKADKRAKGSKATAAKASAPKISPGSKLGRLPPDR